MVGAWIAEIPDTQHEAPRPPAVCRGCGETSGTHWSALRSYDRDDGTYLCSECKADPRGTIVTCRGPDCGRTTERWKAGKTYDSGTGTYECRKCRGRGQLRTRICRHCHKPFEALLWEVDRKDSKRNRVYCDIGCSQAAARGHGFRRALKEPFNQYLHDRWLESGMSAAGFGRDLGLTERTIVGLLKGAYPVQDTYDALKRKYGEKLPDVRTETERRKDLAAEISPITKPTPPDVPPGSPEYAAYEAQLAEFIRQRNKAADTMRGTKRPGKGRTWSQEERELLSKVQRARQEKPCELCRQGKSYLGWASPTRAATHGGHNQRVG